MSKFLIWSFEHQAWWGPHRIGYTLNLYAAGRYSAGEADEIVFKANRYAKQPQECKMAIPPEADWPVTRAAFKCPRCGAVSFNPNDLRERYCGACDVFVDDPA